MRWCARLLQIGECPRAGKLQGGSFRGACVGRRHRALRRLPALRRLLLILDRLTFPTASHKVGPPKDGPYFPCAAARSAGAMAIRSAWESTCAFTIASASATAPASPERYSLLASTSVFCVAGVDSGLS